jgi:hypothetical protein
MSKSVIIFWPEDSSYYPGTIRGEGMDGTFLIEFEDGEVHTGYSSDYSNSLLQ